MRKLLIAVSILFAFIVCSSNVFALGLRDIAGAFFNGTDVNHITYGNDDDDYGGYNNNDDDNHYNNNDDDNYGGGGNDDDHYGGGGDDDHYGGDDDDHYSNDDDDSSEIPLDGGLSFLAVAGAGLGIKKLRDNRARKKERDNEE